MTTRIILGALGLLHVLNGIYMLLFPLAWYHAVPGVEMTGPFNVHFVRDISFIFLASGGLFWAAIIRRNGAFAIAGAVWPVMHALFHIQIWVMMRGMPLDELAVVNLAGIQLPAWLGLFAALRFRKQLEELPS